MRAGVNPIFPPPSNIFTSTTRAGLSGSPGSPAEKVPWSSCAEAGDRRRMSIARIAAAEINAAPMAATTQTGFDMAAELLSMSPVIAARLDRLGRDIRRLGPAARRRRRRVGDLVSHRALGVL